MALCGPLWPSVASVVACGSGPPLTFRVVQPHPMPTYHHLCSSHPIQPIQVVQSIPPTHTHPIPYYYSVTRHSAGTHHLSLAPHFALAGELGAQTTSPTPPVDSRQPIPLIVDRIEVVSERLSAFSGLSVDSAPHPEPPSSNFMSVYRLPSTVYSLQSTVYTVG